MQLILAKKSIFFEKICQIFKQKFAKSKRQVFYLYKSSRFSPKAQKFHLPNLKILKICTQASIFHPSKPQNPQDLHPILNISPSRNYEFQGFLAIQASTVHPQELGISKGFRKTQGSRFPSTHTYRTAP